MLFNEARAQEKFTLEQCVNYAMEHNLTIKQARFSQAITEKDYSQTKYSLLPEINGQISQNFNKGRTTDPQTGLIVDQNINTSNFGVGASWVLFSGLQKVNTIKQIKYSLMAEQSNVEKVRQDVSLNVVSSFLSSLFNKEQVINLTNQLQVSNEQLSIAQKKADVGSITEADFLQFKAQVSTDETNLTTAQNQLEISMLELRQLLNIDPQRTFDIEPPTDISLLGNIKTDYNATDVYNEALKINPTIKYANYQKLSYEKSLQVTRGKYYPTLSMAYNINTLYGNNYEQLLSSTPGGLAPTSFVTQSGEAVFAQTVDREFGTTPFKDQFKNNRGSMLSFTLQIPIFNGLQVRNSTSKAKISYQNAIATEELTKNTLNKTIAQAVADLRAAEKKNVSAQSSYESLKKAYEYSQKRFDVGLINSLDLNIAKTNYSKAESEALQAKYDMIFKSKVIDYYLGKPLTL